MNIEDKQKRKDIIEVFKHELDLLNFPLHRHYPEEKPTIHFYEEIMKSQAKVIKVLLVDYEDLRKEFDEFKNKIEKEFWDFLY